MNVQHSKFIQILVFLLLIFSINVYYPAMAADFDGDGIDDVIDLDDDNDGIPDEVEGCQKLYDFSDFKEGLLEVAYHGGIIKTKNGYSVWGGSSAADGTTDQAAFVPITSVNGYTYSGTIEDVAVAAAGDSGSDQYFILTDQGLYTWGHVKKLQRPVTLHEDMYDPSKYHANNPDYVEFHQLGVGVSTPSLPVPVSEIKSIEATSERLALLTNSGEVWVAGYGKKDDTAPGREHLQGEIYADGSTSDDDQWHHVLTGPGGSPISGIEQIKLAPGNAIAMDSSGNLWTWGVGTNTGNDAAPVNRRYPTQMNLPSGVSVEQFEIAARNYAYSGDDGHSSGTGTDNINRSATYFILGSDGKVYVLGQNTEMILGLDKTDVTYYQSSWKPILKDDGSGGTTEVTDARFISISRHSAYTLSGALITADGTLYEWGSNDESKIGQPNIIDFVPAPKIPQGFSEPPIYVGAGGHIMPYIDNNGNFYNVGHHCEGAFADNDTSCGGSRDQYEATGLATDFELIKTNVTNFDLDGDGYPNCRDLDSDNDGISDLVESGLDASAIDQDNDGVVDSTTDVDQDGLMETVDADDNNANADPAGKITSSNIRDTDNDSVPDFKDLDSDNDGIPDVIEAGGSDPDGDGVIGSGPITDTDGDGLSDIVDPDNSGTPLTDPDSDGDGIKDRLDLDSDNDGIQDVIEAGGEDPDGDGVIGTGPITDTDGDGWSDLTDPDDNGTPLPDPDTDHDGQPDRLDIDSDNDGMTDANEAGGADADGDGRIDNFTDNDGDGFDDAEDTTEGGTPLPNPDHDQDGHPDYLDIDADDDGIPDNIESQPTNGYVPPTGTDSDGDGLDDAYDPDANGSKPLTAPEDTDGDGTPDYLDEDSDNDGDSDALEGWDTDNDGVADTVPTGTDSDGDGLDDAYDTVDNSNTVNDGTNNTMPTTYPDLDSPGTGDRDWRDAVPVANDDTANTDEDTPVTISVLENDDFGIDGPSTGTISVTTEPSHGEVTINDNDTPNDPTDDKITYTPNLNYNGLDSFVYEICDSNGDCDTAEVTVTIDPVVDVEDDTVTTDEDTPVDVDIYANDNDIPTDGTLTINDNPDHGRVTIDTKGTPNDPSDDVVTYTPDADYHGSDTFEYTVCDNASPKHCDTATVTVTIALDSDNDGIPDNIDLDDDNDGIPDTLENPNGIDPLSDSDGDGVPAYLDDDDTDPSVGDTDGKIEEGYDNDGDGVPNHLDIDSDNDGITDLVESGQDPSVVDTNNDGVLDSTTDADHDGLMDSADADDNDPNSSGTVTPINSDGDSLPDYLDIDADNDGIPDNIESQPTNGYVAPTGNDSDGDGLDDAYDPDEANSTPITPVNTDGTDKPDYLDDDSDNDGIPDIKENGDPDNSLSGSDSDGDGLDDAFDDVDASSAGGIGAPNNVNDGINPPSASNLGDEDNDLGSGGDVDYRDIHEQDSDNDGIPDVDDIDDDNDGIPDVVEENGDSNRDTDGDGIPDRLDLDSDGDGILDIEEANGTDTDGDGRVDNPVDVDNDGLADVVDNNSNSADDPADVAEGLNTTNLPVPDTDGDGKRDFQDVDSDNDGISDLVEGGTDPSLDNNNDGIIDDQSDHDGDGICNAVDPDYCVPIRSIESDGTVSISNVLRSLRKKGTSEAVNYRAAGEICGIPANTPDTDGDGVDDYRDLDSDNDGLNDVEEAGGPDADGDGLIDTGDLVNPDNIPDEDNDGNPDPYEPNNDNLGALDENGDGMIDDTTDTDGDGIPDIVDGNPTQFSDRPHVFDPPSAIKTANAAGWPEIEWKMVWINDGNAVAQDVIVEDPLSSDMRFVGVLSCDARGSSTTSRCEYDAAARQVIWEGSIAPDPGATDEVSAINEVVITFRTTVSEVVNGVENQGVGYYDTDGDGDIDAIDRQQPVFTDDPAENGAEDPTAVKNPTPLEVPTLSEWGRMFTMGLMLLAALYFRRRERA